MRRTAMFLVLAVFATAGAVSAATYTVHPDGTGDFPTIQAAIDAASNGDVIELTDGTFTGDGNRDMSYLGKAITIRSQSGNPETCIIDCEGIAWVETHRAFMFETGEGPSSVLEGVSITRGESADYPSDAGAIWIIGSSPTITRCVFLRNHAWFGGAIEVWATSSPTFTDCTFWRNNGGAGGAVLVGLDSHPTFSGCTFLENWATLSGGAVFISHDSNPTFTDCSFQRNLAGDVGGAVTVQQASLSGFHDCVFTENTAAIGAAIYVRLFAIPSIYNSTFYGNSALGHGIVACDQGDAFFENSILAFNPVGESFWCDNGGTAILDCCDIYGNPDGDWVGYIASQQGMNGNMSADPLFCHGLVGDFHLQAGSPCADDPVCGLMGAFSAGCQPATAAVSGVVSLHLESDHSGVKVEALPDTVETYTSESGTYSFEGLYPGDYTIQVSKDGWSTEQQEVVLDSDTSVTDLDFVLTPLDQFEECQLLDIPIPEGFEVGAWGTVDVDISGFTVPPVVSGVEVYLDISHPHTGDLVVNLVAPQIPAGSILFEGSGGDDGDISGWYPGDFEPVTPLDWFIGGTVEGSWQLLVLDLRSPEWSGTLNSWCLRIHFSRDPVAVPDQQKEGVLVLHSNQPNPLIIETRLSFELPSARDVRLQVFDPLGRRVAKILSGPMEAGPHHVIWQGRDDRGRHLPSGVYFYRLQAGDDVLQRKVVVLR